MTEISLTQKKLCQIVGFFTYIVICAKNGLPATREPIYNKHYDYWIII